jgi:hypothetical protein
MMRGNRKYWSHVIVEEPPGASSYQFPIPAPQKQLRVEGFVHWPDGRPAENALILLEDIRWPWRTNAISATTDPKGHFEIPIFNGTAYRVHALSRGRTSSEMFSAEPLPLSPGEDLGNRFN